MPPSDTEIRRLSSKLRLELPIIAVYDAVASDDFAPLVRASGRACCFSYFRAWLQGVTVAFEKGDGDFIEPQNGCPGAHCAFGIEGRYPPYMANFLSDGRGAPMGLGLRASAGLCRRALERTSAVTPSCGSVLLGPLRAEQWDKVKSVSALVDPDRLSALMTLASFWSDEIDLVSAPVSSGCGLLWRELLGQTHDRPVIGCTDVAMRGQLPPGLLSFSVTPRRFEQLLTVPDDSFLDKPWWLELMDRRHGGGEP